MNLKYAPRYCKYCGHDIVGINWQHGWSKGYLYCPSCHNLLKEIELDGWIA